jgi:hypothetical protein
LNTLTAIGSLESTYRNDGQWVEVVTLEKLLEVDKVEWHPDMLTAMSYLTFMYWEEH